MLNVNPKKLCSRLTIVKSGKNDFFHDGYCVVKDKETGHQVVVGFDEDEDDRVFTLLNKILSKRIFSSLLYVGEREGSANFVLSCDCLPWMDWTKKVINKLTLCCHNVEFDSWAVEVETWEELLRYDVSLLNHCISLTKLQPFYLVQANAKMLSERVLSDLAWGISQQNLFTDLKYSSLGRNVNVEEFESVLAKIYAGRFCTTVENFFPHANLFNDLFSFLDENDLAVAEYCRKAEAIFVYVATALNHQFPKTQQFSHKYPSVDKLIGFCYFDFIQQCFVQEDIKGIDEWLGALLLDKTTPCRAIPSKLSTLLQHTKTLEDFPVDRLPLKSGIFVFEDWEYDYICYSVSSLNELCVHAISLSRQVDVELLIFLREGFLDYEHYEKDERRMIVINMLINLFWVSSSVKEVLLDENTGDFSFNKTRKTQVRLAKKKEGRPVSLWLFEGRKCSFDTASPSRGITAHWRKGHFAKQLYGEKRQKFKIIWRQPVLVNKHKIDIA